ncbi:MAG: hypothetical protein WAP51_04250 [Candidatus Sungiibacteriota bacterium]
MGDLNVVFPEYYEWHTEMEKIVKALGLGLDPDAMHKLYRGSLAGSAFILIRCAEKKGKKGLSAFVGGELKLGMLAFARAMENSHDRTTQKAGWLLTLFLFCNTNSIEDLLSDNRIKAAAKPKDKK